MDKVQEDRLRALIEELKRGARSVSPDQAKAISRAVHSEANEEDFHHSTAPSTEDINHFLHGEGLPKLNYDDLHDPKYFG